jgi:hypothetical protein
MAKASKFVGRHVGTCDFATALGTAGHAVLPVSGDTA